MARAINKNKKPEINNKNRARNYFWGSFGSPCSFRDLTVQQSLEAFGLGLAACSYTIP
ncbi:hypothetical protein WH299_27335 [Pseudomonas sp. MYb541]|uniref:Uncharacterized protein n=1 Tax=Pseudomonas canadensis TaxID=915099 RepID=A0ABZ1A3T1_9PSED|nr:MULTISPECIES: hypothetical protein [Pseudomonas]MCF5169870.1 hypothetical protein [Pseudomonas canadensis]MEB2648579.1 hypothetical protein [Pseudomonas canadensis]WNJ85413.1 hypothetical protein RMQ99_02170 [Pseudomonas canadensis]WRI24057.1 hypothetical protein SPL95_26220 [Pseudomonas canadensis]